MNLFAWKRRYSKDHQWTLSLNLIFSSFFMAQYGRVDLWLLWCALSKLRAEKAAWEIAKENNLKLATICPGLITGPKFFRRNPTPTLAYLKGIQEMYIKGLLATVDVNRLAKIHVRVFQEMKIAACGRYICFDQVVDNMDGIEKLARETGSNMRTITGGVSSSNGAHFELSNGRLVNLMSRTRSFNDE